MRFVPSTVVTAPPVPPPRLIPIFKGKKGQWKQILRLLCCLFLLIAFAIVIRDSSNRGYPRFSDRPWESRTRLTPTDSYSDPILQGVPPEPSVVAPALHDPDPNEAAFTSIYAGNLWGNRESRSGPGSSIEATANVRQFLGDVVRAFGIRRLLDSPCGDCNWQPSIPGFDKIQYTGVDIVEPLIEANRAKYSSRSNMTFFRRNIAKDGLPPGQFDAVLCRDMLQHLPVSVAEDAVRNFEKSGARYLITNFHTKSDQNGGTDLGGFYYIDPMRPPFRFARPLVYALDMVDNVMGESTPETSNFKMVALWELPVLGLGVGETMMPVRTEAFEGAYIALQAKGLERLAQAGVQNVVDDTRVMDPLEAEMTKSYRQNRWEKEEARWGPGSTINATAGARRFLGDFLKVLGVRRLLDSPCGHCQWQPLIPGFDKLSYTGIDIIEEEVAANARAYASRRNMRFLRQDLVSTPLPRGKFDAILSRDFLQHLPISNALGALRNFEQSGAKYLVTNFHSESDGNRNINVNGFYYVDPMRPPFNFSQPLAYAVDMPDPVLPTATGRPNYKMIAVWALPALNRGVGNTLAPIRAEALSGDYVVLKKPIVESLQRAGLKNLVYAG